MNRNFLKILVGVALVVILIWICFIPSKTDVLLDNRHKIYDCEWIGAKAAQTNNELPLGYSFNMTYEECDSVEINYISQNYQYGFRTVKNYAIGDSTLYEIEIEKDFTFSSDGDDDNHLYTLTLKYTPLPENTDELLEYIRNQLNYELEGYKRIDYLLGESIKRNGETIIRYRPSTAWFKDNKEVKLVDDGMAKIIYIEYNNLPVQRPIKQRSINIEIDRAKKRNEFNNIIRQHRKDFEKYR